MIKEKIIIESGIKEKIKYSKKLTNGEKNSFLRYIAYFTPEEKDELLLLIN